MLQHEKDHTRFRFKRRPSSGFSLRVSRFCSVGPHKKHTYRKDLNIRVKNIHLTDTWHPNRKLFVLLCQYSLSPVITWMNQGCVPSSEETDKMKTFERKMLQNKIIVRCKNIGRQKQDLVLLVGYQRAKQDKDPLTRH